MSASSESGPASSVSASIRLGRSLLVIGALVLFALGVRWGVSRGRPNAVPAGTTIPDETGEPDKVLKINLANPDNPAQLVSKKEADTPVWDPEGLEDFTFTERSNRRLGKKDLLGQPWVAGFVFTRCAGPCPKVTGFMKELHDRFRGKPVRFVTFSVDPHYDTAKVLSKYASFYEADADQWLFFTGDQAKIYGLIQRGFRLPVKELSGADRQPGWEVLHSTNLMLVDAQGRVVAKYNAVDEVESTRLRHDLEKLLRTTAADAPADAKPREKAPTTESGERPEPVAKPIVNEPDGRVGSVPKRRASVSNLIAGRLRMPAAGTSLHAPLAGTSLANALGSLSATFAKPAQDQSEGADHGHDGVPEWAKVLPTVNASLNALSTILLITGYVLIRKGNRHGHKFAMLTAFGVSVVFLMCYLVYHAFAGSKPFQGQGLVRVVYFALLISHIVLAAAVPVLAILTIRHGLLQNWSKHRTLARYTFPIWLYVSVTGVIIYGMLYHWPISG